MNKIQCEVCGSNALTKKDGVFQCDDCGTKYTLEEMRKLLNGSSAPVQAVKPNNDSDFAIHAGELQHYYGASPNVVIPEGVRVIGKSCFAGLGIESVVMPDSVKEISACAFEKCTSLTSVRLSENLEIIGGSAFACCEKITSIEIPKSVTSILDWAFFRCTGLTSITIPENVKEIGIGSYIYPRPVFQDCRNLTTVTILGTDIIIGKNTFMNCKNLAAVIIKGNIKKLHDNVFLECSNLASVCVDGIVEKATGYFESDFDSRLDYEKCSISPENRTRVFKNAVREGYCPCCLHKIKEEIIKGTSKRKKICPNCGYKPEKYLY
ncbi:MAG: leucine-rich repeat domain-containing protein [Oscillospiraceae bacterium]|nr:leucine-rich repeat domain-containing protein [Oscillospiraceae bacterium]